MWCRKVNVHLASPRRISQFGYSSLFAWLLLFQLAVPSRKLLRQDLVAEVVSQHRACVAFRASPFFPYPFVSSCVSTPVPLAERNDHQKRPMLVLLQRHAGVWQREAKSGRAEEGLPEFVSTSPVFPLHTQAVRLRPYISAFISAPFPAPPLPGSPSLPPPSPPPPLPLHARERALTPKSDQCQISPAPRLPLPRPPHPWTGTHSQEWSMPNFSRSFTRNITSHNMKNLAFHSLLRWKMIILPILTTSLSYTFLFKRFGECTL